MKRRRMPPTLARESLALQTCDVCVEKRKRASQPVGPAEILQARAVLQADPPFGPKVRLRYYGRDVWVCPRCDSVSEDENGPRPIMLDFRTRRARRVGVR